MPKSNEHYQYQHERKTTSSDEVEIGKERAMFQNIFGSKKTINSEDQFSGNDNGLSDAAQAFRNARDILRNGGISNARRNLRNRLRG